MKKWGIGIVLLICICIYSYINIANAKSEPTIKEIVMKMEQQNIEIEGWSLYAKQGLLDISTVAQYEAYVEKIKGVYPNAIWVNAEQAEAVKTVGTYTFENVDVRIVLNYIKKENKTLVSIQFTGQSWDEKLYEKQNEWIEVQTVKILKNKPVFFTCVKGQFNGNLNTTLQKNVENILTIFTAEEIERAEEDTFLSVSAYTEQWKAELPIQQSKMNMQIALREIENNNVAIVIGTPIITMEY
ncbi:MAG: YwmB family TATA-box binding protein [Bacillaceae bacterium]